MSAVLAMPGPRVLSKRARSGVLGFASRVIQAGTGPVSPASAAAFRIVFGLLGIIAVVRFAANGWISGLYIEPSHHLSYFGFGWVQPWPVWGMYLHFALMGLAALGVALGYRYRLSIIAFFLLFTYVELIDRSTYLNHYYLVSLISVIMVFLPLERMASLDTRNSSPDGIPPIIPRAALWTLRAQVGLVYVFAGIAKLNPDWMLHAEPLRIWLYNGTDTPFVGPFLREAWVPYAMSWGGACFDLTIVGWLLWKRTRPYAYAVLVVFHVATAFLFPSIGMFPWIMIGAALIFFEPDWPLRLLGRVRRQSRPLPELGPLSFPTTGTGAISWRVRAVFLLGAVFLAVQVAMPLRHLAYPGDVRWTEEGYLFSWRVLLTEKTGFVNFRVMSPAMNGERLVYPEEYLTPAQVERMAYQPDLILATAHIVRDDFISRGHEEVEVRADAYVTHNGRPATRLVDPDVDLARVNPGIGHKRWILSPPEGRVQGARASPAPGMGQRSQSE